MEHRFFISIPFSYCITHLASNSMLTLYLTSPKEDLGDKFGIKRDEKVNPHKNDPESLHCDVFLSTRHYAK